MTDDPPAAIVIDGVSHSYGERPVLREISLTITERRVGIVGANGSGKSTLARLFNGLVLPDSGAVRVHGLDTRRSAKQVRRLVGFVFTDPDRQILMPTVAEDIELSLSRRSLDRQTRTAKVAQVLERFGLAGHADQPAHLLSGGQKQLLALATVLVTEPAVVVADEPTTLLDLRNARMLRQAFAALHTQLVIVTHDLDLVDDADRVIVLDDGRVVADDVPSVALSTYRRLMT
ncbi:MULTISPECIES: energy-coupling factor ABC transporter ATP-binding protein [Mycolicibacterium]|jgi:biotin transport system ATP-binding protein|uniref:ABC transporter-related protein n=2 Tax=Mycolicibacterium TaxID=1866885 RepID=A1TA28_MYCVP|nr:MULTISPECIES: ABC transporter ATP-binding protein [Mycolicibacterium]ABM14028.1 ABC transporter-related protein [Mycolicibacterium vanbaalenii PYR-1]MCV7126374.1 ABC transporter ATP-binding protein [Mycolicibacterium vanbaalenii PYR-1]MDN4517011.1 ABC transporter ATP-binding protein [Mycolicibacterium austroafricanum]QRZ04434.1 ABC transporter ATP-binding protein [Mycolicibacterium austroafricanum]QZT54565.1 energy-coupling factor ABC transporter ATP-binding protein [Mycolicibacterium austr